MINVGISRVHNSAVTLLKDGEIIFHIENERLSNIKYDAFPFHTLLKLPEYVDHVDNVCIAGVGKTTPCENFTSDDIYTTFIKNLNPSFKNTEITTHDLWDEHHKMHAACAFYNSGFSEALCIIKDGMGSEYELKHPNFTKGSFGRENGSTFVASYPSEFKLIDKDVIVPFECDTRIYNVNVNQKPSEALMFQKTSKSLGFNELDAGKVMGLSSYGESQYDVKEFFEYDGKDVRTFKLNKKLETFTDKANFAHALQRQSEKQVKDYILKMVEQTGIKNVCLSGGFFLNCVANYEYLKDLPKDIKIYIEPISSDAGTSIGAAKYVWHKTTGDMTIRKQTTLYHGLNHSYTLSKILDKIQCDVKLVDYKFVAELIATKHIVAIYQGRSESGPRALGNRSILYDPRDPNGRDYINEIKKREWFRPFAGSVLHEEVNNWFDMRGLEESPFMMYAVNVLQPEKIPAITHVDSTCRIQTVKREQNKHYYNLISEFYKITGVPIVFNTSFNLAGDCIVETIEDAIRTLKKSKIDYLYLPEFKILVKNPN